MITVLTKENLK